MLTAELRFAAPSPFAINFSPQTISFPVSTTQGQSPSVDQHWLQRYPDIADSLLICFCFCPQHAINQNEWATFGGFYLTWHVKIKYIMLVLSIFALSIITHHLFLLGSMFYPQNHRSMPNKLASLHHIQPGINRN